MNDVSLLMTSGNGPSECHQAVAGVLHRMQQEAETQGLAVNVHSVATKHGFKSAVVLLHGDHADAFSRTWIGTIQWRAKSTLRPQHKRSNWFIGVFKLPVPHNVLEKIDQRDVFLECFRAGGPGGQHQNTTDSAIRATHKPTGLSAIARDMRSQHQNKALALQRLEQLHAAQLSADAAERKTQENQLHKALERGNPVRSFKGPQFKDVV